MVDSVNEIVYVDKDILLGLGLAVPWFEFLPLIKQNYVVFTL